MLCEIKRHFDAPEDRQEHLIITIWSSSSSPKKGGYSLLYQEEPAGQTVKPKGGATRWNRWKQVEEAKLTKASRISARQKLDKTLPFCKSLPSLKKTSKFGEDIFTIRPRPDLSDQLSD